MNRHRWFSVHWQALGMWAAGILLLSAPSAHGAEYKLAVQPVLPAEHMIEAYAPLARYLSAATGHRITITASSNFLTYWETMRRGEAYDLVLDAAHFVDFRVQRMNHTVVAKLPDTVSYSLVTGEDLLLFDADEMIGRTLATVPSPSLGGVRLSQIYPNPSRQPVIVETADFEEALARVLAGQAAAALVPTPLIRGDGRFNTVLTTEPVPHMALSASTRVAPEVRTAIREALLATQHSEEGRALLTALNLPGFEAADSKLYEGYGALLEGVWGY